MTECLKALIECLLNVFPNSETEKLILGKNDSKVLFPDTKSSVSLLCSLHAEQPWPVASLLHLIVGL